VRATTVHSDNFAPLIYRVVSNVNDLDAVEGSRRRASSSSSGAGSGTSGRARRTRLTRSAGVSGRTTACRSGSERRWRIGRACWRLLEPARLEHRHAVSRRAGADRCLGGLYTELLPRTCDAPGVNCSTWATPTLHWLNVRKLTLTLAGVTGIRVGREQASAAVADGPDDGPEPSDVVDVDQNGVDTTAPGYTIGQRSRGAAPPAARCLSERHRARRLDGESRPIPSSRSSSARSRRTGRVARSSPQRRSSAERRSDSP
jgi:hypothetical protein